jgi:hypothetical protein
VKDPAELTLTEVAGALRRRSFSSTELTRWMLERIGRWQCKPHIRRELIPATVPHSGRGELQENGTTLCRRRCSAMPNNGDVSSDHRTALRAQRRPDWRADQAAGFKTAPSGTTPSMTNLHSAISSFRAKATTMILRTRRPVDPTRSRNQQT